MATNPLYANIGNPVRPPKPRPKTPAEIASAMLVLQQQGGSGSQGPTPKPLTIGQVAGAIAGNPPASSSWQAPKPNLNQMVVKPLNGATQGPNDWLDYHEAHAQNGTLPPGTTVVGPNGQATTIETTVGVKPKKPNVGQQVAGIAMPLASGYAINQGIDAMLGNAPTASASAATNTPSLASSVSGSLPSWNINYGPANYLSDSMQLPASIGVDGPVYAPTQISSIANPSPWWAAPEGSSAAALGSNITSGLEYLGVGSQTAGTIGSGLGTAIPVAGGLYSGYNLAQNLMDDKKDPMGGALSGAGLGASLAALGLLGPVGPLAALALGAAGGGALGMIGSGKDKDQIARDQVRKALKEAGVVDDQWNLTLADGSKFDIGADGSIQNYNVDFGKEGVGDIVAATNPLAAIVTGGNPKLKSDFAGYFTNAAMSAGDSIENIKKLYADAGLDHAKAYKSIQEMVAAEKLSKEEGDAYLNGLDQLFGVGAYGSGQKGSEGKKSGGSKRREKTEASSPAIPAPATPGPAPTYGQPSGAQSVSVQDYINAIVAVNQANQSENQGDQIMKLMKMKNPLYGSIV